MKPPHTLICTVGTSLFYPNLSQLDDSSIEKQPEETRSGLAEIRRWYLKKDWARLGQQMLNLEPGARLCGAEINSIASMIEKGFLDGANLNRLVLLVSDTRDGEAIGTVLRGYFTHINCPIRFNHCDILGVEGLQDENPLAFQKDGLVNLVRHLGSQLRMWGSNSIVINATGGYKAQIALAVAFGQATRCPVFYKHERFNQIIRFPRIPFTIDLSMVEANLKLWADMTEPGAVFGEGDIKKLLHESSELEETLVPMLEVIEENGVRLYAMSALGMVYWEAYLTNTPGCMLKPVAIGKRRGCRFRDDHYPIGFKDYVCKVYESFPDLISECHSLDYSKNKSIRDRFYKKDKKIIGEYVDKDGFGGRFEVLTGAANELERSWVVAALNRWLNEAR